MIRVLLAVLAWPVVILLAIWIFEFVDERYLNPPQERVFEYDHPKYTHMATQALEKYGALDAGQQARFRDNLQDKLVTVESWANDLERDGFSILCIGEDHIDLTRDYLARELFTRISLDVLLLEATPSEVRNLLHQVDSGQTQIKLLGAEIGDIVRQVRAKNPEVSFAGIEETQTQKDERLSGERAGIRDDSIVKNVWANFVPGKRHAILFGAIHCNNWPKWLYQRMRATAPAEALNGIRNLRVVERKQDSLVDPFLLFLDEIGIERRDFVVADTKGLDPLLLRWFSLMVPQIFSQYETILVFRSGSQ